MATYIWDEAEATTQWRKIELTNDVFLTQREAGTPLTGQQRTAFERTFRDIVAYMQARGVTRIEITL